jgi:hypothetical protein
MTLDSSKDARFKRWLKLLASRRSVSSRMINSRNS